MREAKHIHKAPDTHTHTRLSVKSLLRKNPLRSPNECATASIVFRLTLHSQEAPNQTTNAANRTQIKTATHKVVRLCLKPKSNDPTDK